jgi:hypothetical protein
LQNTTPKNAQGKVEEAGRELEKAIRLDPSNPLPFINKVRG